MKQLNTDSISILRGTDADILMLDAAFLVQWQTLYHECPYATVFQSPGYVITWYGAYKADWEPILVLNRNSQGELVGLWTLAWQDKDRTLAHAGVQQAEYHSWLAQPGSEPTFLPSAWKKLRQLVPARQFRCKYLPDPGLAQILESTIGNVEIRRHTRPILQLNADEIRASFAKKSNKSRFSRLKKFGSLEFRPIKDATELESIIEQLTDFYDFRQGAINNTSPFMEDSRKRKFHLALFAAIPKDVVVTVTYLAGRPLAAFWGLSSHACTHLGMLIHAPFLAEHSPGKLHLMQLSEFLLQDGKVLLDLTPGGDAWKERFANHHDEVAEAVIYGSSLLHRTTVAAAALIRVTKRALGTLGMSPNQVRSLLAQSRRASLVAVLRKIKNWADERREFRIYRLDRAKAECYAADSRVRHNAIADLLLFEPWAAWQTRDSFLSAALSRLEAGSSAWTIRLQGKLAHCGWMGPQSESYMTEVDQTLQFPPGSVALYDFFSAPDFRGQGLYRATIGHMIQAAFAVESTHFAYISVLGNNGPSRHVIEDMGFEYQGSYYWRRRLGSIRKWSDVFAPEAGNA